MTKEEAIKKHTRVSYVEGLADPIYSKDYNGAMDEYAKQQSIDFFKWYVDKMTFFLEYIKDIRPSVTSNEVEEKIKEFEGKDFDTLYNLFLQSQTPNVIP